MLFLWTSCYSQSSKKLSKQLVDEALKLYEIEYKIKSLYFSAYPNVNYAGEGIDRLLYNDPIQILDLAIHQDSTNAKAYFWKGKMLFTKAHMGEGDYNISMLRKAYETLKQYDRIGQLDEESLNLLSEIEAMLKESE